MSYDPSSLFSTLTNMSNTITQSRLRRLEFMSSASQNNDVDKIKNAFSYDAVDTVEFGTLANNNVVDKPLSAYLGILSGIPGSILSADVKSEFGIQVHIDAKYNDNGRISTIQVKSGNSVQFTYEYIYNTDGKYSEKCIEEDSGLIMVATYNADGTLNSYAEYLNDEDYNAGITSELRNYSYSIDDSGNPFQDLKENGEVKRTTYTSDGKYVN